MTKNINMKHLIFSLLLLSSILGCKPKISKNIISNNYAPLDFKTELIILNDLEIIPKSTEFIGEITIKDSGANSPCGYAKTFEDVKYNAKMSGANVIVLTKISTINLSNTCYKIKASLFRSMDEKSKLAIQKNIEKKNKSRLAEDADYAIIYFYRPVTGYNLTTKYKIQINQEPTSIGKLSSGDRFYFKTKKFGKNRFWVRKNEEYSIEIDVKKGQEYFVKCAVNLEQIINNFEIKLMETHFGKKEFEQIK